MYSIYVIAQPLVHMVIIYVVHMVLMKNNGSLHNCYNSYCYKIKKKNHNVKYYSILCFMHIMYAQLLLTIATMRTTISRIE